LTSADFKLPAISTVAVALIHCYRLESVPAQIGIALYKIGDIYYRFCRPESLLLITSAEEYKRENCIIRFETGSKHLRNRLLPDLSQTTWIVRETPEKRHGFTLPAIKFQDTAQSEEVFTFHLGLMAHCASGTAAYPTSAYPNAMLFSNEGDSNDRMKQSFVVVVGTEQGLPWVDILRQPTDKNLSKIIDSYRNLGEPRRNITDLDQISKRIYNARNVSASIVRGLQDGERVFFVDISIRDIRTGNAKKPSESDSLAIKPLQDGDIDIKLSVQDSPIPKLSSLLRSCLSQIRQLLGLSRTTALLRSCLC
jgi:hypothetical protein